MSTQYISRQTKRGDYLVTDVADRQISRHDNEAEAQLAIVTYEQRDAAAGAERDRQHQIDEQFRRDNRDLTRVQIRWQNWRNWLYDYVCREGRRVAGLRRWADDLDLSTASGVSHDAKVTAEEQVTSSLAELYFAAVVADGRIKAALRSLDDDAWKSELQKAAALAHKLDAVQIHGAVPPLPELTFRGEWLVTAGHCDGKSVGHPCTDGLYQDPTDTFEETVTADTEEEAINLGYKRLWEYAETFEPCACRRHLQPGGPAWTESVHVMAEPID